MDIHEQADAIAGKQDAWWDLAESESRAPARCSHPGCTRGELHQHIPDELQMLQARMEWDRQQFDHQMAIEIERLRWRLMHPPETDAH